jgi:hypothetical protein
MRQSSGAWKKVTVRRLRATIGRRVQRAGWPDGREHLGSGRVAVSYTEAPNLLANPVCSGYAVVQRDDATAPDADLLRDHLVHLRVRSHCRFRNRGTESLSESGIKWVRGMAKRQRDRALCAPPALAWRLARRPRPPPRPPLRDRRRHSSARDAAWQGSALRDAAASPAVTKAAAIADGPRDRSRASPAVTTACVNSVIKAVVATDGPHG